ncbi:MAG TPA: hypothetical protein VFI06_09330, partial [Chitinophagaceae bacterium]|nr:hypothetical protein [Chitinophagaceae bacterium]
DIDWLLMMGGGKRKFFGVNSIFSPAFYLPYEYENAKGAMSFDPNDGTNFVTHSSVDLPASPAADNLHSESIQLSLAANNTDLVVARRTVLKGHYKKEVQEKLVLFEDYCNAERRLFGENKTITEELQEKRGSKKTYATELQAAFDKERGKQKESFVAEVKDWFEQPVNNLSDYRIENLGVRHNNPDFIYSSKFSLEGLVKKAGSNLIIDIGKLEGSTIKSTPALRKRKVDIYMPFARSIESQIQLKVPEGYTVEGIKELNRSVRNSSGVFIVEAAFDGHTLTINIKKAYNHSFESIANWDKLIEFIDAASDWTNSKVLLKKK